MENCNYSDKRMKTKLQRLKEKAVKLASDKNLKNNPYCLFCSQQAKTSHHFIHQSRSNYLRCDERNLISICQKCHMRLHSGYESLMALQLVKMRGDKWRDSLIKDSNIKIKDGIKYWKEIIRLAELTK